ncbi:MAG TPA: hypothetical protein VE083_09145 [Terriglobales bacterium]|nr:hypothetical protein [Terriglobales bacterium]
MTHALLVRKAVEWLRGYRCGVVLSEQACVSGEMPDAIGWKRACHSVLVECKISRPDFLADRGKPFRQNPQLGVGSERFYLAPRGLIRPDELPPGWGLLEHHNRQIKMLCASRKNLRNDEGFRCEMNLLLASLRRVEIRIEPQTVTEFLKWKNRMAEYNRGRFPEGVTPPDEEANFYLQPEAANAELADLSDRGASPGRGKAELA